jgi:ribosomal protein L30/L7E
MNRKQLNHNVRALAHGTLGLNEEEYRTIVYNIYPKSDGHISRCDDEHANLVLLHLKQMNSSVVRPDSSPNNSNQQKLIARLMDILDWKWSDTAAFCLKITGHRTTRLCDAGELSKVIRGMIATIDHHLEHGKITMTRTERFEYERHVRLQRAKSGEHVESKGVESMGEPVTHHSPINHSPITKPDLPF